MHVIGSVAKHVQRCQHCWKVSKRGCGKYLCLQVVPVLAEPRTRTRIGFGRTAALLLLDTLTAANRSSS